MRKKGTVTIKHPSSTIRCVLRSKILRVSQEAPRMSNSYPRIFLHKLKNCAPRMHKFESRTSTITTEVKGIYVRACLDGLKKPQPECVAPSMLRILPCWIPAPYREARYSTCGERNELIFIERAHAPGTVILRESCFWVCWSLVQPQFSPSSLRLPPPSLLS